MGIHHQTLPCMQEYISEHLSHDQHDSFYYVSHLMEYGMASLAVGMLIFFMFQYYGGSGGWEVVVVVIIETCAYVCAIVEPWSSPFTLFNQYGTPAPLLRHALWLMTTHVVFIALANLHGDDAYNTNHMLVVTCNICSLWLGILAALSGSIGLTTFYAGLAFCFGIATLFILAKVYVELYFTTPKLLQGRIGYMSMIHFVIFAAYPVWFCYGPEGYGHLRRSVSVMIQCVTDFFGLNIWCYLCWSVRAGTKAYRQVHPEFGNFTDEQREKLRGDAPDILLNGLNNFIHFAATGHHSHGEKHYQAPEPKPLNKPGSRRISLVDPERRRSVTISEPASQPEPYPRPTSYKNPSQMTPDRMGTMPAPALRSASALARDQSRRITDMGDNKRSNYKVLIFDDKRMRGDYLRSQISSIKAVMPTQVQTLTEAREYLQEASTSPTGSCKIALVSHGSLEEIPALVDLIKGRFGVPLLVYTQHINSLEPYEAEAMKEELLADELMEAPDIDEPFDLAAWRAVIEKWGQRNAWAAP